MPVDLYYVNVSPPCRAVVLGAKAVGVKLNLKTVDLRAGEHLKPEFIKMNPRHTIPTMDDNGFTLGESRAILGYLADQYAKTDSLYPKDAKKRAVVNQRLNYDIGTLFQAFKDYYCTQMYAGKPANPENFKKLETAFEFLEKFLEGQEWVAGSNMTIADITIVTTVSTAVMNPQHTVPTMNDNGFILAESRAILRYLVDKYAKNDSLYPKDLKKRAKVEEKLDFDVGTLVQGFANYYYAGPAAKPEDITKLEKAFGILEKFLEGQEWVAGSGLTIADIAIVTTVSSAVVLGFSLEKFPNISRWLEKCKKTIPSYEELSNDSLTALKQYFEAPPKK